MGLRDVVILGYDAISPLGEHLDEQWRRAAAGESGIGNLTRFELPDGFPVRIAGQVADIGPADYPFLSARHQAAWSSPVFKYALLTVTRALERSGLAIAPEIAPRVAVTYGSAVGGLDAVVTADRRLQAENKLPHPYANPNSCINMVGGKIAIETAPAARSRRRSPPVPPDCHRSSSPLCCWPRGGLMWPSAGPSISRWSNRSLPAFTR